MKILGLVLLLFVSAGCGDIKVKIVHNDQFQPNETESYHYIKSYNIGEKKNVFIGDPIVRWQLVSIKEIAVPERIVAKTDFELKGKYLKRETFTSNIQIKAKKGVEFYLIGTTSYNGIPFNVLGKNELKGEDNEHDSNDYYLLIDKDGSLNKNVLIDHNLDRKLICVNPYSSPNDIVFIKTPKIEKHVSPGMLSEIIFGGVNNVTINATYREYTPDDIARQAFYQSLVYQTSADIIRFRGFKIKVHEVTNEKITFTVLEDGLIAPKSGETK